MKITRICIDLGKCTLYVGASDRSRAVVSAGDFAVHGRSGNVSCGRRGAHKWSPLVTDAVRQGHDGRLMSL